MKFDYTVDWLGEGVPTRVVSIDLEGFDAHDRSTKLLEQHRTFYENDLLRHLAQRGPCGGVYVDVGANIGNHSVFFGKFLADFVVAIEPIPKAARVLERNLVANDISQYAVVNCAVGAVPGRGRLVRPKEFPLSAGSTQVVRTADEVEEDGVGEIVPISTVDRTIEDLAPRLGDRPVTFMKIDVEGMECEVLTGAKELIRFHRPQLAVELADAGAYAAFSALLTEYGYSKVGRFGWTPTYHFLVSWLHKLRGTPCDRLVLDIRQRNGR